MALAIFLVCVAPICGETDSIPSLIKQGEEFWDRGDVEHAASVWEQVVRLLTSEKEKPAFSQMSGDTIDTLIRLSDAYQALGHHRKALSAFESALPLIRKSEDKSRNALFFSAFGDVHLSLGNMTEAFNHLEEAETVARSAENPHVLAAVLNNFGNLFVSDGNYQGAVEIYDECLGLLDTSEASETAEAFVLKSRIFVNLVSAITESGTGDDIRQALDDARDHIGPLPDSREKAEDMIALSIVIGRMRSLAIRSEINVDTSQLTAHSHALLDEAKKIAEYMKNSHLISYSHGEMGKLYEEEKRYAEAIRLTRRAVFFAEQGKHPEILYLWQCQMGRLRKAQGRTEDAIKSYESAISTLNPIRQELFKGYRSGKDAFNENIKPVYLGLAELLLEQAESVESVKLEALSVKLEALSSKRGAPRSERKAGTAKPDESPLTASSLQLTASSLPLTAYEQKLREARDVMELLKTAELQNFFDDECVTARQNTTLNRTAPHTAVLYPIMFPEKLAILLTLPDGMKAVSISTDAEHVRETALNFRMQLQTRPTNQFFYEAQQLHDWLIRPVETLLTAQKIDTLIIVPDGALRLIPFSTLHDGEHYLVERYAIATIPGVTLTDAPKPLDPKKSDTLLAGLSESVQGFPRLPSVSKELQDIQTIMNAKVVLKDQDYTIENLTNEFRHHPYAVVHLATHGVFGGSQEESFLLTYDSKLTMNHLERLIGLGRFRDQQVELLTLSACQTAQGDERAALGLAGVALKAGVRGAIATLWYVDDEATARVVKEFYKQLRKPSISKAKALQNAQKELIAQRRYRHPGYWAPFLLMGNWL